jgi:glycosyltransferase involved in cell wall biosynthesis
MVAHNHGLMWAKYEWPNWAHEINRQAVDVMVRATAHTAPSRWVANALRRSMLIYPEVVYHGVDPAEWPPEPTHQGYVLWNKARADAVSDPADLDKVAVALRRVPFVTTFGQAAPNVTVTGPVPYDKMRTMVRLAGVYLATARETFGIGTLEAMAAGVPVAGWDWGGQREIVTPGITGHLAPPGDYSALAACVVECLKDRERLGNNAHQDVLERWTWEPRIAQYADVYRRAIDRWRWPKVKVSVIITCYNLARFLAEAAVSVLQQSMRDLECLIVDDCSTDETAKVMEEIRRGDKRVRCLRTPENLGLAGARNFGFAESVGRYVLFLDADDMLAENALVTLSEALERDSSVHIAGGHLTVVDQDGHNPRRNPWPYTAFDWRGQMAHLNQMHYAALMRREVMDRSGGYRTRAWRAEDAEQWCRVTSLGFRARKVTEADTLIYRDRPDSKSKGEPGDGDWTAWFPWHIAASGPDGVRILRSRPKDWHPAPDLVPFSAQGDPPTGMKFWKVHDRDAPDVSVVIPVGPGHERYVRDALESVYAQDESAWECIVVNDTGKSWPDGFRSPVAGCPWALVVPTEGGPRGAAQARNLGAQYARGKALLWLDADDFLLPGVLREMMELFDGTGGIVYGDWLRFDGDWRTPMEAYASWDFKCGAVLRKMQHSVTSLVPREAHERIGGFDTNMQGWEDWDYFIALQAAGLCSYRLPRATFVYRFRAGRRREASFGARVGLKEYLYNKWRDYYEGRLTMACPGGCGDSRRSPRAPNNQAIGGLGQQIPPEGEVVLVVYQGPETAPVTIKGPTTGTLYRVVHGERRMLFVADLSRPDGRGLLQRTRKGVPDFLLVDEPKPAVQQPVEPTAAAKPPEFPAIEDLPGPAIAPQKRLISEMKYAAIYPAILDADRQTLLEWLAEERGSRNRKKVTAWLVRQLGNKLS